MASPLISEVLPDLLEEIVQLLQGTGAEPLEEQLRRLRIESICDCGDENCASFATAAEVKVANVVELQPIEGYLIIDLNPAEEILLPRDTRPRRREISAGRIQGIHRLQAVVDRIKRSPA